MPASAGTSASSETPATEIPSEPACTRIPANAKVDTVNDSPSAYGIERPARQFYGASLASTARHHHGEKTHRDGRQPETDHRFMKPASTNVDETKAPMRRYSSGVKGYPSDVANAGFGEYGRRAHVPEKWEPVFRKGHAP
jgi:hypothetical protein